MIVTVLLHLLFLTITFFVSGIQIPKFHFVRQDRVAILFCATQKTAALGIPLISIFNYSTPLTCKRYSISWRSYQWHQSFTSACLSSYTNIDGFITSNSYQEVVTQSTVRRRREGTT
jgi:predicted Na+-dependent transporter